MKKKPYVTAIILAGGSGSRMGEEVTKQKITLCGSSVLRRSVRAFSESNEVDSIVVVCREDEVDWAKEELADILKIQSVVSGGKTRAESAFKGFSAIPEESNFVAIHDAARCLITKENIDNVIYSAYEHKAATAGTAVTDTIKVINGEFTESTIPRNQLFIAHTPQIFARDLYENALNNSLKDESITDDNMLVEKIGVNVFCVDTGKENIKITTKEDLSYAEYILERRRGMSEIRVGHGYDVHRLVEGRRLVLGGVEIPHTKGLLGHSDADVLIHAIMDAILGACAMGDIGRHFPDSSAEYKDISSLILLKRVYDMVKAKGFSVVNIDATVVMQRPKIAAYIACMVENISKIMNIEQGRINIKATTEEGLGFTGCEEGVVAHAVATIKK